MVRLGSSSIFPSITWVIPSWIALTVSIRGSLRSVFWIGLLDYGKLRGMNTGDTLPIAVQKETFMESWLGKYFID